MSDLLSEEHRANFRILAKALLSDDYSLDMDEYFSDKDLDDLYRRNSPISADQFRDSFHMCGSSCCALGLAAVTDGLHRKAGENDIEHCLRVFGFSLGEKWIFVFHDAWPSDKKEAAARCLYMAEHGKAPDYFDQYCTYA